MTRWSQPGEDQGKGIPGRGQNCGKVLSGAADVQTVWLERSKQEERGFKVTETTGTESHWKPG